MKSQFYLVVTDGGSVKAVKNKPDLKWNEVSVLMNLQLPAQLFQKPQLQATITVDEKDVCSFQIDAKTTDNIQDAIESATGIEVRLELIKQESAE